MLILICLMLIVALYVVSTMYWEMRKEAERLQAQPEPVMEPGVNVLRAHIIRKTGLPIQEMYRMKGHWYINIEGSLCKVEDVLRSVRHNPDTEAQEALRSYYLSQNQAVA